MKRKFHAPESPWASFSDALSGVLFVFVITTFWFAIRLKEAEARSEQATREAEAEKALYTEKAAFERRLVDPDDPTSLTACVGGADEGGAPVLQAEADPTEPRVSLYLENVAWFPPSETTFADPPRADAAIRRVSGCIEALLAREDLGPRYRLRVYVEGHTDAVPYAERQTTNWELSGARAARVLRRIRDGSPALQRAQDNADVELIGVGWAELKPATSRLCTHPADALDRELCAPEADRAAVLRRNAAALERTADAECRPRAGGPAIEALSEPELLRRWANRCLDDRGMGPRTEQRLAMLRRVDLRIELLPRGAS